MSIVEHLLIHSMYIYQVINTPLAVWEAAGSQTVTRSCPQLRGFQSQWKDANQAGNFKSSKRNEPQKPGERHSLQGSGCQQRFLVKSDGLKRLGQTAKRYPFQTQALRGESVKLQWFGRTTGLDWGWKGMHRHLLSAFWHYGPKLLPVFKAWIFIGKVWCGIMELTSIGIKETEWAQSPFLPVDFFLSSSLLMVFYNALPHFSGRDAPSLPSLTPSLLALLWSFMLGGLLPLGKSSFIK